VNGGDVLLGDGTLTKTDPNPGDLEEGTEGCAATTSKAELSPVYLLFLLDESGSMGDDESMNREERWDPVTTALKAFFADAASSGLLASLSLFPNDKNKTKGSGTPSLPPDCAPAAYSTPVIAPRALPDATSFADAISAVSPPNEYGTPTLPALSGTLDFARSLQAEDASRKVAVVLVTDGEPNQCDNNSVTNIATAAAAVAATIPTYVIGVGSSLTSLNEIAVGGGTKSAFIVSLQDPEQTRSQFSKAINEIRGRAVSCELDLPAPPVGMALDPDKVRVELTPAGQAPTELPFDADCLAGNGWHYDNPAAPKRILLCEGTCSSVKVDTMGKLDVVFGCQVRQDVK